MRAVLFFCLSTGLIACPSSDPVGPAADGGIRAQDGGESPDDAGASPSDSGSRPDSGPVDEPTEAEALAAVIGRYCAQIRHCWDETLQGSVTRHDTLTLVPSLLHIYESSPYCLQEMTHSLQRFRRQAAPSVGVDLNRYQSCLEQLSDCASIHQGITDCAGFLRGTVAAGEGCVASIECADDGYCRTEGAQCGECVARGNEGEDCGAGRPCHRALRCEGELCVLPPEPVATGEACSPGQGLRCRSRNDLCLDGVCTEVSLATEEGAVCSLDGLVRCGSGLFCIEGACTGQRLDRGEACGRVTPDGQPGPDRMVPAGVCGDGICVLEGNAGTCRAPGAEGEFCRQDEECAGGHYCNREASACALRGDVGEPCTSYRHCASAACDEGPGRCVEELLCP